MNRLMLCSMSVPWPKRPGLCAYHVAQSRALRELGVEMDLFSPAPALPAWSAPLHRKLRAHLERPRCYQIDGVTIRSPRCPFAFTRAMRFAGARVAPRALARLADVAMRRSLLDAVDRSAPDALLAHGVLPWGDVVRSVASETGLPFAFVEHSAEDVLRLRRGTALARYYRSASRGARAVLAVGRPMVRHLREELSLTNISFLPNGTQLPPDPGALHPRPAAVRNKLLLLAAGHYYPRKGFEVLVDAFAKIAERHPRAVLRIVTDAPPALQRRVAGHGLGKRLQIMPTMDQALLQRWMSWSDLFVLPSWAEAFALVGIEAMAAGTPVVLTRDCGLASMIRPVRNGRPDESRHGWVVEPHRADALAATLDEALHHERWLARLGEAGRKLVVSTFTWHRNGRIILDALQPRSVLRCSA